jgi:hypothetical protein
MLLYPRLSPQQGKQLAELRSTMTLLELRQLADVTHTNVTYAPTGGTRVTEFQLASLRKCIQETAKQHGFEPGLADREPLPLNTEHKGAFDAALAVMMHKQMRVNPAEACRPGVWRFIGTVLAPAPIRWRFPGDKTTHERFLGNRLRNMYGRVWWRAHLLQDKTNEDPYWLLKELGEDELVQITERPNAAGYQPLAVGMARGLVQRWNPALGVSRSGLLREAMKRLLRLLPLVRFEALSLELVTEEIDTLFDETLRGLGIDVEHQSKAATIEWQADAQWQDLALTRRADFLKALTDDDITRLSSLNDVNLPDWGEYKPKWKALFRIHATAGQVLGLAPAPAGLARDGDLGVWLTAEPAGSWQTDVDPARGKRLLGALRESDLRALYSTLGWDWLDGMTHSGSQRYMRRRYSGSWQTLVRAVSDEAMAHVVQFLRLADSKDDAVDLRLSLARWLTVAPELTWNVSSEAPSEDTNKSSTGAIETASVNEPRSMPQASTGSIDLNAVVPTPAGRLINVLARAGAGTIREMMALDIDELKTMQGVGPTVASGVRAFGQNALSGMLGPTSMQTSNLDLDNASREIPEPPSLLINLLKKLDTRTFGDLFGLDLAEIGMMSGVGPKKINAIRAFQKELLATTAEQQDNFLPNHPASLDELVSRMVDELSDRESTAVSMRFGQGATLAKLGDALGLSRERARQIMREAMRRLHACYGLLAISLLEEADPGLGGLAYDCSALGLESWQGLFATTVAHNSSWIYAKPLLWAGTASSFDALEKQAVEAIEGSRLNATELLQLGQELDAPVKLLRLLLTRRLGWLERDGELVFPKDEMPRDQWVLMRLREAGPTHQSIIAQWMMERDGLATDDLAKKAKSYVRQAEGLLSRLDDAWRWDRGTFIHTAAIPVSQAELRAMVGWCTERIVGRRGPYGVKTLLSKLSEAGFDVGQLNHYVLKDALVRDDAVIAPRKGNIGCAEFFDELGVDLEQRILRILQEADRPLAFSTIIVRLPAEYEVSEIAIRQCLSTSDLVFSPRRGEYAARNSEVA